MNACESSKIYTFKILLLHAKCITLLLFHPGLRLALAELKLHKMYSFYSKYIDMNACESSKIYTFIIILLHAKCIILRAPHFSPGLGTGVGGVQVFCFAYCTYIYRISSFHQHRHRAKKKNMCVYGHPTHPNLFYQQLFHPNFC